MTSLLSGAPRRLPARIRIFAALVVTILAHAFFSADFEALRIRVLCALPLGGGPDGLFSNAERPVADPEVSRRAQAWREGRAKQLAAQGRTAVPVLFFREKDGIAIIGAGRSSGLEAKGPVDVPAGLLGFIDAVEAHVSRVRLLSSPRSQIPVQLAESRPALPGEVTGLNAVLEGTGDAGRLIEGALLMEFREGDRLAWSDPRASTRPFPVGIVSAAGPAPAVRLLAGPGDLGLVTVASDRTPEAPLFEVVRAEVRTAQLFPAGGALISAASADRVAPGCAVHDGGRYLGRVVLVAGKGAVASRLADSGHRVLVRCLGAGNKTATGELVGKGEGRFELSGIDADAAGGPLLAVTAGGQDLVPADLAVGFLERSGSGWVLRDALAPWPRNVMVSVFTFGEELTRLLLRIR